MLANKTALVTGSTSGIGLGIAHQLAKAGCRLVLHGFLDESKVADFVQSFKDDYGVNVFFSGADLRDVDEINAMAEMINKEVGGIDILVNNAGIQYTAPLEDFPLDKWNDILAINLSSSFHTMQKFLPAMQSNQWGRIINISSVHGLVASVNKAAYCAAKHGLVGLTKVAALENADKGICINTICPGWVSTPLIQSQIDDIAREKGIDADQARVELITAKQPRPEMVAPSQIGDLVVFLCSDSAAGITGANLPIDGAWTAQ